jgi:uncharacterized protein YbjT (DUF2867 family)
MILVVGASGNLGRVVTQKLIEKGVPVRAMSRKIKNLEQFELSGAEIIRGDLLDKQSLQAACKGASIVVASAHALLGRGRESSKHIDYQGHLDLVDAAKAQGVKHFMYISVQPGLKDWVPFIMYKHKVEEYLKSSGLNYTILRAGAFMEFHLREMIGNPLKEKGKVTIFGKGNKARNYVSVRDVADFAIMALESEKGVNKTLSVGGPDNISPLEAVSKYEKILGRSASIRHIPPFILKTMSVLMKPFHSGLSQVMNFSYYADKFGETIDMTETLGIFPKNLISVDEWIEQFDS